MGANDLCSRQRVDLYVIATMKIKIKLVHSRMQTNMQKKFIVVVKHTILRSIAATAVMPRHSSTAIFMMRV